MKATHQPPWIKWKRQRADSEYLHVSVNLVPAHPAARPANNQHFISAQRADKFFYPHIPRVNTLPQNGDGKIPGARHHSIFSLMSKSFWYRESPMIIFI